MRYSDKHKRLLDVIGAVALLILTLPIITAACFGIFAVLGRPIVFRQQRAGRHGMPFSIVKLRTMRDGAGSDLERTNPMTRLLRMMSIDELPQLYNVLRGDMSLVGPRPLLLEYVSLYSPEQIKRLDVKPGITGIAQISGRNMLSWEERFALDVWYVENASLMLDLKILLRTIFVVVSRKKVNAAIDQTMPMFKGSR